MAKKSSNKTDSLTPRALGFEAKEVSFDKKTERKFKGAVGLCELGEKKIYVDKDLPRKSSGSRKLCLNHELVHARIGYLFSDNKIGEDTEERYVEIEAICWTGTKYLSAGEYEIKRNITDGGRLNIRKLSHKREVVARIFDFLHVKVKDSFVEALANKKVERENAEN